MFASRLQFFDEKFRNGEEIKNIHEKTLEEKINFFSKFLIKLRQFFLKIISTLPRK